MHPVSNVAQRVGEALMHTFHDRMDEAEELAFQSSGSTRSWRRWREAREQLQREAGLACHLTRRWWRPTESVESQLACPQARLYAALMYTDDPIFITEGSQHTLRALRPWRQTTNDFGLTMAIPAKRSLESWAIWLGVVIFAVLGVVSVATAKLLRAQLCIDRALADVCEFHEY